MKLILENWKTFLKEGKKLKGYKITAYENGKLYSLQNPDLEYRIEKGTTEKPEGGMYLGTSEKFVTDYYSELTDKQDALLEYEYDSDDILSGSPEDDGEVKVKKATLISYRVLGEEQSTKRISFDVDDTLIVHAPDEDLGTKLIGPYKENVDKLKKYQNEGHEVFIITTRGEQHREETMKFLSDQNISISPENVILTKGKDKADTLESMRIDFHYDDDIHEKEVYKQKYPKGKTNFIIVPTLGGWDRMPSDFFGESGK